MSKAKDYAKKYYDDRKEEKKIKNAEAYLKNRDARLVKAKEKREERTLDEVLVSREKAKEYYKTNAHTLQQKRKDKAERDKQELISIREELEKLRSDS
jgi:hypothetical protein|tara:strand:+ start:3484 stop:3777 length:294 start_codon:yes stop_codon:yes gene_type:complete